MKDRQKRHQLVCSEGCEESVEGALDLCWRYFWTVSFSPARADRDPDGINLSVGRGGCLAAVGGIFGGGLVVGGEYA